MDELLIDIQAANGAAYITLPKAFDKAVIEELLLPAMGIKPATLGSRIQCSTH